jgi:thioredoxin 1
MVSSRKTAGDRRMGTLQHVDDNGFREVVNNSATPVLVDFFADWCAPCKRLAPTLEALAETLAGRLTIVKVNVDQSSLPGQFDVMNIPTIILFKDGQEVKRLVGNQAKNAIEKALAPYLA